MATTSHVELGGGLGAASRARQALADLADRMEPATYDDVRLLITELVTNGVRHAGVDDSLRMAVFVSTEMLRAEVHDGGAPFAPAAPVPLEASAHGWGLVMVDRIADRWGVESGGSKYVWFEIDRPSQAAASA
jgi:anti-sigma regulatory factor (Ser/Thr protein kinase)